MTTRTTHQTVKFKHPARIIGIKTMIPAGSYGVDTDEETIDGLSFVAWRRTGTLITVTTGGLTQSHRVDPSDLDASLAKDGLGL